METQQARIDPELLRTLVRRGDVYDLAQPIAPGVPVLSFHPPYTFALVRRHGDLVRPGNASSANELLVMCAHTGTHLDALCHYSRDGKLYGGIDAQAAQQGPTGFRALGIEQTPPLLQRGVLLDIPAVLGVAVLDDRQPVDGALLEAAAQRAGLAVGPGDAVLVRTGWARRWSEPARFVDGEAGCPGLNGDGARWLLARGVRLTGNDTPWFEVQPRQGDDNVHALLIADHGVQILENLNLERLSADGVAEFLLVVLPLPLVGATGSPVRPVAIV
ncbi:MAG: cyclase family protein [Chloroflexi bacterium]|nr:cyclase family protein [Chloroflexota bacterium]